LPSNAFSNFNNCDGVNAVRILFGLRNAFCMKKAAAAAAAALSGPTIFYISLYNNLQKKL
jgi:hypothetical protein